MPTQFAHLMPDNYLSDEWIAEKQRDDEYYLVNQIRKTGALFTDIDDYREHLSEVTLLNESRREREIREYQQKAWEERHARQRAERDKPTPTKRCPTCHKWVHDDTKPCDVCHNYMSLGIIMIEIEDGALQPNPKWAGGWLVATPTMVKQLFSNQPELLVQIMHERGVFIESKTWAALRLPNTGIFHFNLNT